MDLEERFERIARSIRRDILELIEAIEAEEKKLEPDGIILQALSETLDRRTDKLEEARLRAGLALEDVIRPLFRKDDFSEFS